MTVYEDTLSRPAVNRAGLVISEGARANEFSTSRPMARPDLVEGSAMKRMLDIVLAGLGLLALLPLLLIVALLIKLDSPGGVFFRQKREGLDGKLFSVYKFRTMRTELGDTSGVTQTVSGDPRVTPIGRFLRRTSIDELPQLINVLTGDMSLVGPRPHVPGMLAGGVQYRELVSYYDERHRVRPGITGWAQVNGLRGSTVDHRVAIARIDYDIAYIENWSLGLDLKILFLTVWREFTRGTGD
jgi:exopolysaccharide biosynthesis polyprenyl glycosylphosphotransferase